VVVYLSILLVIEIIWCRKMRLLLNDEPGEDVDGSGSRLLLLIIIIIICQGNKIMSGVVHICRASCKVSVISVLF